MNSDKKWLRRLAIGICTMIIGAFIFFQTRDFTMFLSIAIGIYAIVNGILVLVQALKSVFGESLRRSLFIRGGVSLGIGLIALLMPFLFAAVTWTFVLYVLGIQLIASAGLQIYLSIEYKRLEVPVTASVIEICISLALAFLIFTMPQEIGMTIIRVVGFILFAYGLVLVIQSVRSHLLAPDETV